MYTIKLTLATRKYIIFLDNVGWNGTEKTFMLHSYLPLAITNILHLCHKNTETWTNLYCTENSHINWRVHKIQAFVFKTARLQSIYIIFDRCMYEKESITTRHSQPVVYINGWLILMTLREGGMNAFLKQISFPWGISNPNKMKYIWNKTEINKWSWTQQAIGSFWVLKRKQKKELRNMCSLR